MREIIALCALALGFLIPWSGPFTFTVSFLLIQVSLLFLLLCLGERFLIGDRFGHRIDATRVGQPPLPPIPDDLKYRHAIEDACEKSRNPKGVNYGGNHGNLQSGQHGSQHSASRQSAITDTRPRQDDDDLQN